VLNILRANFQNTPGPDEGNGNGLDY